MDVRAALAPYPLFDLLDAPWLDAWLSFGEVLSVAIGDLVFQAGTPGRHLFLIQEGRVRVLRPSPTGGELSFGTLGPGDLFGEYALLRPGLNTATCRAATEGRLLRLPLAPLQDMLARRSEISAYLKRWLRLHALLGYRRGGLFLGFMSAISVVPLLERFESVRFAAAHAVQAEGLCDDRWFVIESGQVALHRDADALAGRTVLLGPGDSFGARALLDGHGLALAVTHAETACLTLRRAAFYQPRAGTASSSGQTFGVPAPAAPRPFVWVGQQEAADCGVAALAMVARYHELAVSLPELRRTAVLGPAGVSLLGLQQLALSLGFRSQAVRLGFEQMTTVSLPAIAHQRDGHYVVVYALNAGGIVVADPASGVLTVSAATFRQTWSGNLLLALLRAPKS